ncbi:MAG: V-type ATP synthase subunit A [Anaerofustis sp.]
MSLNEKQNAKIIYVNGSVLRAEHATGLQVREMVTVGSKNLIGEVISVDGDIATLQVYEETTGLKWGEDVKSTGKPLSVRLGPGIIGGIFDGIERPLTRILADSKSSFIPEGIGLISLDMEKLWDVEITVKPGDFLMPGTCYATTQESAQILHRLLVPPALSGEVLSVKENGSYNLETEIVTIQTESGTVGLKLYQDWPIRDPRPSRTRNPITKPLVTGQRIIDTFFPLAKGGTCAIPGGFGTGKTITQHQIAKWSDADLIVYIGCGERGNEITEVLEDFPGIIDPRSGESIMERTILIANTSNMPVAAREASIYTGITIAEYYRDMGYSIAIMADSTSRWAEALREISGRLEEMPAEEGYPAYLPSRLAQFYERAADVTTLEGKEGTITIIGAVSPAGGDMSEPVTMSTKRVVNTFLALDKNLAYARHYPAINWLNSYSGYVSDLQDWYDFNISKEMFPLRNKFMSLLQEENKLSEIVKLVGEDILPDDQRLILEISKVFKNGYLQQNAYHKDDASVSLQKQFEMLKIFNLLYDMSAEAVHKSIPLSTVKNDALFYKVSMMKYNIPENQPEQFYALTREIEAYYKPLIAEREKEEAQA